MIVVHDPMELKSNVIQIKSNDIQMQLYHDVHIFISFCPKISDNHDDVAIFFHRFGAIS